MTTLKSCSIDDQYKHVSFKDLEGYLAKNDYLGGYCEAEKELVRQNLGIETYKTDSKLSEFSTNPVENRVVTEALKSKADIHRLPKVAVTGDYCDLHHKPHFLPNPQFLVIQDSNGTVGYNGEEPLKIKLPTHTSELVNDAGFLTDQSLLMLNYVKGIKTTTSNIIFPDGNGIITLDIPELTGIDHELSLTSHRAVENKVVSRALQNLHNMVPKKLDDLSDVSDAEHPVNGQLMAYVKVSDDCDGYWKPLEAPHEDGDILVFNGTEWKIKNISELFTRGLWTMNDSGRLTPDREAIEAEFGENYSGDVQVDGNIYSETI